VENKNISIVDATGCMLTKSGMNKYFLVNVIATTIYLQNRIVTITFDGKTSKKYWSGMKPNIEHLKILHCITYMHIPNEKHAKLDLKVINTIFVGYSLELSQAFL
jgi:hypothetical protein